MDEAGENYMLSSFVICTDHQILLGWSYQGRWYEWACGVCGGEDKFMQDFVDKICSKKDTWKSRHDNIKMCLKEMGWEDVDWVHLAPDRDKRLAVVYTVINGQFP